MQNREAIIPERQRSVCSVIRSLERLRLFGPQTRTLAISESTKELRLLAWLLGEQWLKCGKVSRRDADGSQEKPCSIRRDAVGLATEMKLEDSFRIDLAALLDFLLLTDKLHTRFCTEKEF
jgi:hypothetical protein